MIEQNKGLKAHQSSMICSGDSKQGFGEKMFFFFSPILIHVHEQGCTLCKIGHFTLMDGSEAEGHLVLIQTFFAFLWKLFLKNNS